MAIDLKKLVPAPSSAGETIDGEIYVRLGSKRLAWRTTIFLALATVAMGAASFASLAEFRATTGGKDFTKGTTQCPGTSPSPRSVIPAPSH